MKKEEGFWLNFIYRVHAIERMFQRDISEYIVQETIINGKIIEKYLDDKPYPSFLILSFENQALDKPIHVVYAKNNDDIIIITVYRPSKSKWINNYKTRLKKWNVWFVNMGKLKKAQQQSL